MRRAGRLEPVGERSPSPTVLRRECAPRFGPRMTVICGADFSVVIRAGSSPARIDGRGYFLIASALMIPRPYTGWKMKFSTRGPMKSRDVYVYTGIHGAAFFMMSTSSLP